MCAGSIVTLQYLTTRASVAGCPSATDRDRERACPPAKSAKDEGAEDVFVASEREEKAP